MKKKLSLILFLLLKLNISNAFAALPIVDEQLFTGAKGLKPPSKLDGPTKQGELTVLRENYFEDEGVEIDTKNVKTYLNDPARDGKYSQSLLFRSGPVLDNQRSPETEGEIVFPKGINVIGIFAKSPELDSTDEVLGLGSKVNYTASARGMESSDVISLNQNIDGSSSITFKTSFNKSPFVDEFRVLIDYGDYFIANTFIEIKLNVGDAVNVIKDKNAENNTKLEFTNKVRLTTDLLPGRDSDDDGIEDIVEREDDSDKILGDIYDNDKDLDGIPSYYDKDSDGDGVSDKIEQRGDIDRDGLRNYLDPDDPEILADDSDQDGLVDSIEKALGLDPNDSDSDDDGLLDGEEVGPDNSQPYDHDHDMIIDPLDNDDDNDTIPTKLELALIGSGNSEDTDGDGIKDWHDTDANGNDIPDKEEAYGDLDKDGLMNKTELRLKTDPKNADSDGDSLSDLIEIGGNVHSPLDTDRDTIIDALDNDDDNDGIPTLQEVTDSKMVEKIDVDNDGFKNWHDVDSDDDKILDAEEINYTTSSDNTLRYLVFNEIPKEIPTHKDIKAEVKTIAPEEPPSNNTLLFSIIAGVLGIGVVALKLKK
jgi:hypothetical protein